MNIYNNDTRNERIRELSASLEADEKREKRKKQQQAEQGGAAAAALPAIPIAQRGISAYLQEHGAGQPARHGGLVRTMTVKLDTAERSLLNW